MCFNSVKGCEAAFQLKICFDYEVFQLNYMRDGCT